MIFLNRRASSRSQVATHYHPHKLPAVSGPRATLFLSISHGSHQRLTIDITT
ncbi:MAG: hypothetical protein [Olavius algarvensis Delta 4 endosymbiont]|nr:MAG: hypothetical protein [Olavius algarvensis Delta 4 endosymbiont]